MATNKKPMPGWFVISPLHHDGKAYLPGDAVPLSDEQGAALLALGVVSQVPPVPDAEPAETSNLA